MTAYYPASSFGWLDFDAATSERVATLLRTLQEPATLDVLGLGSVRDAFSQMLHPGTSYIHTRLRYFMFLPWIFRRLEADRVTTGDFYRRLRDDETRLIDCLRHLGPGQGVIGYWAGRNLKRMPSSIYWGGLWDWGIRQLPFSLDEYAQRASAFGRHRLRDDDGNVTHQTRSMWAPLEPPPGDFLQANIDFELRHEEAQDLVDNIRNRHPQTLLAALCANPGIAAHCTYPWDVPESAVREPVAETLHHARCFSELATGPQHTYNILVARRARRALRWNTDQVEQGQLAHLQEWVELVHRRRDELRSWADHLPAFWALLDKHRIPQSTRNFIATIVNMAAYNPEGFKDDPTIHEQIRFREIQLKGKRARLRSRAALENWNGDPVGGQHEYRWSIAKGYLRDIATALEPDS